MKNAAQIRGSHVGPILDLQARMARPLRIQQAGLAYHAMARGNNKMPILLDDLDYARLLQIYADVVEEFRLTRGCTARCQTTGISCFVRNVRIFQRRCTS